MQEGCVCHPPPFHDFESYSLAEWYPEGSRPSALSISPRTNACTTPTRLLIAKPVLCAICDRSMNRSTRGSDNCYRVWLAVGHHRCAQRRTGSGGAEALDPASEGPGAGQAVRSQLHHPPQHGHPAALRSLRPGECRLPITSSFPTANP